ncbi:N-terminal acetyltransferase A, auxiliary subunit [Testicularia cyperi]|uniref:N-terminal acetyltransferase A, auxiliary subunit n=1 Tax=Testicularia cyperi TaxID=1882483 RepID=A0A317XVV6_9BASI|nr:N-terminal acetyltransferase A, auxiliary subunit [Testicularia cyperi]
MPPKRAALPTKERTLFTRLIQEYETKKYKLGHKTADTILKKFPDHGETLAMKGLLLGSTGKLEEGVDLAKKGLRFDLTSFICWHALGILHRMDRNYDEAIKCYSQALRIEGGNNINLVRESAFLQLMLRNFPPMIENRLLLLRAQPHLRLNWIGLAVAHHLAGSLDAATQVLEGYQNVMRDVPPRNYEHSEAILYHASILEEKSDFQKALDLMENQSAAIVDAKGKLEIQARCLAGLGQKEEAEKLWRDLIRSNADNHRYFAGLLSVRGITLDSSPADPQRAQDAVDVFKGFQAEYPKSSVAKRIALVYATGDEFKAQATAYVKAALVKGVPSLFSDLKSLYRDPAKQATLEEIVEALRLEWAPTSEMQSNTNVDGADPPSSYLWSLYYLAQHYSLTGDSTRALQYIDSAIAHSSTLPELHMARARILKRAGDLEGASDAMTDARLLDGQDRFLNSKAAKYLLRINDTEESARIVGLFTKPDAPSPVYDLNEMQALWYLGEEADAFERRGDLAMSLKRHATLDKIFQEFWDDQLDFHSYCMRKQTLRSYVRLVRFEDNLRSHPAYFRSAVAAIGIYTRLHDQPGLPASQREEDEKRDNTAGKSGESNGMSQSQKNKAAKKAKLATIKAAEEEARKRKDDLSADAATAEDDQPKPDSDPKGEILFGSVKESPLKYAEKYLRFLATHAPQRPETWTSTFEVAIRKQDWLLATKAVAQLAGLDSQDPRLPNLLIRLKSSLPDIDKAPAPIGSVIQKTLAPISPPNQPVADLQTALLQRQDPTPFSQLEAAKTFVSLNQPDQAIPLLVQLATSVSSTNKIRERNSTLKLLIRAQHLLLVLSKSDPVQAQLRKFNQAAGQVFPLASAFKSQPLKLDEAEKRKHFRQRWHNTSLDLSADEPLM